MCLCMCVCVYLCVCVCVCVRARVHRVGESQLHEQMYVHISLIPRPLPAFQLFMRKRETLKTAGSGLGTRLHTYLVIARLVL